MVRFVMLLLVAVGYASYIAAGVAGCITSIIKCVNRYVFLVMAYRAFIPMVRFVMLLLVVVGYVSHITTSIACRVTGVVEDM